LLSQPCVHIPPLNIQAAADIGIEGGAAAAAAAAALSADFLMHRYKVEACTNPINHDWQRCPFAHGPKDKARRRNPALFAYAASQVCPDKAQGRECPRGDACPFTHTVAEYW